MSRDEIQKEKLLAAILKNPDFFQSVPLEKRNEAEFSINFILFHNETYSYWAAQINIFSLEDGHQIAGQGPIADSMRLTNFDDFVTMAMRGFDHDSVIELFKLSKVAYRMDDIPFYISIGGE